MFKILILPIGILILLSGCSTSQIHTTGLPCKPPIVVMESAAPLPKINTDILSMRDMFNQMLSDAVMYDDLKTKNNILINWVKTHCQK